MRIPKIILLDPNRVWRTYPGGKLLDRLEGKKTPQDTHFPEDWIASTTRAINPGQEGITEEGHSKVKIDGSVWRLKDLMQSFSDQLLGKSHFDQYGSNTQFLLKFLDSSVRLHLQCHPTRSFAQQHLNSDSGKTEAYIILSVRDGIQSPFIYLGFQRPMLREVFRQAVLDQDFEAMFTSSDKIPVKSGDVFLVPGGLTHAIGKGIFMIEIMEPTDHAIRLEFERGGYLLPEESRFMGRSIDFGMDIINFVPRSIDELRDQYFCQPVLLNYQGNSQEWSLIDPRYTDCFSVKRLCVQGALNKQEPTFYVGIVVKGFGSICSGQELVKINCGDRFLVPFSTDSVQFVSPKGMEVVLALPPSSGHDKPLQ